MSAPTPFTPGATTAISGSTSTAVGTLTGIGRVVRVNNASGQRAFIKFGAAGVTAATTDTPMEAGTVEMFSRNPDSDVAMAVILAAATGTVYATVGEGE